MKNFSLIPPEQINFFSPNLIDQLNPEHGLITPAKKLPWNYLEKELSKFYHRNTGRPAKPIRLMTGLLILNQRFSSHPKNRKRAIKARRELKTIVGRLVRELNRKLPAKLQKHYRAVRTFCKGFGSEA